MVFSLFETLVFQLKSTGVFFLGGGPSFEAEKECSLKELRSSWMLQVFFAGEPGWESASLITWQLVDQVSIGGLANCGFILFPGKQVLLCPFWAIHRGYFSYFPWILIGKLVQTLTPTTITWVKNSKVARPLRSLNNQLNTQYLCHWGCVWASLKVVNVQVPCRTSLGALLVSVCSEAQLKWHTNSGLQVNFV